MRTARTRTRRSDAAIEVELEYETPWVTPYLGLICDTRAKPGALYGEARLMREWELCDILTLVTYGGIGFGNPYHNDWCFERDRWRLGHAPRARRAGAAGFKMEHSDVNDTLIPDFS